MKKYRFIYLSILVASILNDYCHIENFASLNSNKSTICKQNIQETDSKNSEVFGQQVSYLKKRFGQEEDIEIDRTLKVSCKDLKLYQFSTPNKYSSLFRLVIRSYQIKEMSSIHTSKYNV